MKNPRIALIGISQNLRPRRICWHDNLQEARNSALDPPLCIPVSSRAVRVSKYKQSGAKQGKDQDFGIRYDSNALFRHAEFYDVSTPRQIPC